MTARPKTRKRPWLAAALNIIPGVGYLYVGTRRAFTIMIFAAYAVAVTGTIVDPAFAQESGGGTIWDTLLTVIMFAAFMVDGFFEARRVNAAAPGPGRELQGVVPDSPATDLFIIGTAKFLILSCLTFSLYSIYWFYRQWRAVRARDHSNIWPFWRAIFWFVFMHSLLTRIQEVLHARDRTQDTSALDRTVLYTGISVVSLVWKPLLLVDLLKPFILAGVQARINEVYEGPRPASNRLGVGEWILAVTGSVLSLAAIAGIYSYLGW